MQSRHGAIECRVCGTRRQDEWHLSYTGQCPECGLWAAEWNLRGLLDKESVPYKIWQTAYQLAIPGRPKITTPPEGWIANSTVYIQRNTL